MFRVLLYIPLGTSNSFSSRLADVEHKKTNLHMGLGRYDSMLLCVSKVPTIRTMKRNMPRLVSAFIKTRSDWGQSPAFSSYTPLRSLCFSHSPTVKHSSLVNRVKVAQTKFVYLLQKCGAFPTTTD